MKKWFFSRWLKITDYPTPIKQSGFTLIELLVTMVILTILASIILGAAAQSRRAAEDAQRRGDLRKIQSALQQYYADNGHYPLCLDLDSHSSLTEINNCTGNANNNCGDSINNGSCTSTRVYLPDLPYDPFDDGAAIHYCYAAYTQYEANSEPAASSNLCFGTNDPRLCQYFKLYAPQWNNDLNGGTNITCHEHRQPHTQMRYALDSLGN